MIPLDESAATSGPELLLHLAGTNVPPRSCILLGIAHGKMHVRSDRWLEPGSPVSARFARHTLSGKVLYCTRKETWFRTCIELTAADDQRRSEPRLGVHQCGSVITLSGNRSESSVPGTLLDLAVSGMRLEIPHSVEAGTMIYVETESALMAGEVRHCRKGREGWFEAGVLVTDILYGMTSVRSGAGTIRNIRRKLAQAILGEEIAVKWS
jgi:hypothetical protein